MKIPTTYSGNGYYGHENGVIAYIDNEQIVDEIQPSPEMQFAEYMWMEHEEEFDKQVLQQLEEEELMEECLEAMLEEERQHRRNQESTLWIETVKAENENVELYQQMGGLSLRVQEDIMKQSNLNPDAAEFVPGLLKVTTETPKEVSTKS